MPTRRRPGASERRRLSRTLGAALVIVGGVAALNAGQGTAAPPTLLTLTPAVHGVLTPGASATVSVAAHNSSSDTVWLDHFFATVTTSNPGCLPAWFRYTPNSLDVTVGAGHTVQVADAGTVTFIDETDDQHACANSRITINVDS